MSAVVFLLILWLWPSPLLSHTSAHCSFNQLCACKYAPNSDQRTPGASGAGSVTTEATFRGQFGTFTASYYDDDLVNKSSSSSSSASGRVFGLKPAQNTHNIREVSCIGVPFARIPDFPVPYITHVDLVDAGLQSLDSDVLSVASTIESARFMNNKIAHVDDDAFRAHFSTSLKSLDLSYNRLTQIPLAALSELYALDWLNLHGNLISSILPTYSPYASRSSAPFASTGSHPYLSSLKSSLSTLFLGANDITEIPQNVFADFRRLLKVNLDENLIKELKPYALPRSLLTLSLANNLVSSFPLEALSHLPALTWLTLRGNYIENIPTSGLALARHMDKIDLGENFITDVPHNMFNGTLTVNDLNLDYNYIEELKQSAFVSVSPRRLFLGMNRLSSIHPKAFAGLEDTLELIDLEGNDLHNVSEAFGGLRQLRYLYLANNNITTLSEDIFSGFCKTLRALSLSRNGLEAFPVRALARCEQLAHLNLGYNKLRSVGPFGAWAQKLDTLILRNNRLTELKPRAFKGCPHLRELSLSFNALDRLDSEAFKDVGTTLESLEISFGLRGIHHFPGAALRPLQHLHWLSLDNNGIETVEETSLYGLGELQYLNLEVNRLSDLPPTFLHKNVHKRLLDVRLAYNRVETVKTGAFSALARLQTVVLTGNRITLVESGAFRHLPNLVTLMLTHNRIAGVAPRAFIHLDNLQKLELQHNRLTEFSLNTFENCTKYPTSPMTLNLSHNDIRQLTPMGNNRVPLIQELDVSHNRINKVPKAFLEFLSPSLRILDLGHNQLSEVDRTDFKQLFMLQVLGLSNNYIVGLAKTAFHGLTGLQILDLSGNNIEILQFAQFSGLSGLRSVNLAHNRLRSLPRDVFQSTLVETVDLSFNEFVAMPTSALTEASATVRHLNLSHNRIEHVDSTMFANTPHLISLSLAHNRLTILPDNIFIGLGNLQRLELGSNPIRANYKELFHYVQRLRYLDLSFTDSRQLPPLPLPALTHLDASGNGLSDMPYFSATSEGMPELRWLNLSMNGLSTLDVSYNPVRVLTKESFYGLGRLQALTVRHLPDLKRFDADSLSHLRYLRSLHIQSWPSIEKFKFRLGAVVSGLSSLRVLSAMILEPNGILYDQILGAFGPKLRELEIIGPVKRLTLEAFEGIDSHELLLTIRDTELRDLPIAFIDMFYNVKHLSLDLRNNMLEEMSVDVFYNGTNIQSEGTRILEGGLALQGNPWRCSCENVWLGAWLRRWMRETLQLHTSGVERGQAIQDIVRTITCTDPQNPAVQRPLVNLDEDVKCYRRAQISAAARQRISVTLTLLVSVTIATLGTLQTVNHC